MLRPFSLLCTALLTVLTSLTCLAQSDTPFSIVDILSAPFPTDLTASPAGRYVAWVFNDEGVRNIWTYEMPSGEARQLTAYIEDDGQALGQLQFMPDESALIFVRGDAPNRAGEHPNPTSDPEGAKREIYKVDMHTSDISLLAEGSQPAISHDGQYMVYSGRGGVYAMNLTQENPESEKAFSIRGAASQLTWNPANNELAFVSNRGDHSFIGVYDFDDNTLHYISPSVDLDRSPAWSPDGTQLAFMRFPHETNTFPFVPRREALPWSIIVASADGSEAKEIWKADTGMGSAYRGVSAAAQLMWSDRDHLVFPWEKDGWTHLYSIPSDGGEPVLLSPGDGEVQYVYMTPGRERLYFSSNIGDTDRQHIWRVSPQDRTSLVKVTEGEGVEWAPVECRGTVFCLASSGTTPAQPVRLDQNNTPQPIVQTESSFPYGQLSAPEQVIFTATDGQQIHGQLFKPAEYDSGDQYPAVLFFHGGSRRQMLLGFHHRGYYHNAFALNQYLANQGYLVLSVNYRSGIGYGMEFREALNYGANGASEFQDVLGAGLYMRQRPDVDDNRIGLWGGSYGGYLTALGLSRASDLFAAGVDIHGVHDWNVVINNFVPSYKPVEHPEVAATARRSSPVDYLDTWTSPVLFIHGDDDRNVPFSETVTIVESLRRRDVNFEQLVFPDEVHGFLLHRNWIAAYEATAAFFDLHLKK